MAIPDGRIEAIEHYDALGNRERLDYWWVGGDVVEISEALLVDADPSAIRYDKFPAEPGDRFRVGPFALRVLEPRQAWRFDVVVAVRDRGLATALRCLWHRFGRVFDIAYRRLIVTLSVWRLADLEQGTAPTWRDVRALRWLAERERARPMADGANERSEEGEHGDVCFWTERV